MADTQHGRVFGLDLLRAMAIGGVVLAHGGLQFVLWKLIPAIAPSLAPYAGWSSLVGHGGAIGVELFFVLSGFLIGGILLRTGAEIGTPRGLFRFYTRRWFRTLPLFALALLGNVLFERYFHDRVLTGSEITGHGFFLRNFAHISLSFFPESWSLAVEEWFYLLFPAALFLALLVARGRFARIFLPCAALFFLFSLGYRTWAATQPGAEWVNGQRCTVLFRFDALMTGVIAAWLAQTFPHAWRRRAAMCGIIGLAAFAVSYATFWVFSRTGPVEAGNSFFARTFRFSCVSLSFALLLPFASTWVPARETFVLTIVRKIALWSYAIYLLHWPLFQLFGAPRFQAWQQGTGGMIAFYVGKILFVIGLSALVYRFYEAPCMRLRDRLPFGSR